MGLPPRSVRRQGVVQAWPLVPELVLFVEEGPRQVRVLLLAQVPPQARVWIGVLVSLQVRVLLAQALLLAQEFLWMRLCLQDLRRFLREPQRLLLEWPRVEWPRVG